jgi:hypothetical protein
MKKIFLASFVFIMFFTMFGWCDNNTEFVVEDDLTVNGTQGTYEDPDVELKGFVVIGATQAAYTANIPNGPGNLIVNGTLGVSSGAYIVGNTTITYITSATFSGASSIFINDGDTGQILKKSSTGNLIWSDLTAGGDNLGNHIATMTLDMANHDIINVSTLSVSSITTTGEFITISTNIYIVGIASVSVIRGLSAPLTDDSAATKAYVDALFADRCASGTATTADILYGKTADINCDNVAEVGTMPIQTLSDSTDVVNAGYYEKTWLSQVDPDLASANIAVGKTIFGFDGTYTSDANATADKIVSGYTAYVNGVKLTGTLATQTLSDSTDVVNAGYYNATTLSSVDPDLNPKNIVSGVTIFGKTGIRALPDTGQTSCYDSNGNSISCSGAGQDGSYNPSTTQLSYTDNGNGTVTDNRTGLMWKKCSEPDTTTNCSGTPNTYSWTNAISQCENLNYAGYTDWRLPNTKELFSLIKYQGSNGPYIDTTYFPNTVSGYYWTSTTYAPNTTDATFVSFSNGNVNSNNKTHILLCSLREGRPVSNLKI